MEGIMSIGFKTKYILSFILALGTFALAFVQASAQSVEQVANARKSTYQFSVDIYGSETCSGTAVGKHAFLTASHCDDLVDDKFYLKELKNKGALKVVDRISDKNDHTIYLVKQTFLNWVDINLDDKLEQGEDIFYIGNPGDDFALFRKGYVAGSKTDEGPFGVSDDT